MTVKEFLERNGFYTFTHADDVKDVKEVWSRLGGYSENLWNKLN